MMQAPASHDVTLDQGDRTVLSPDVLGRSAPFGLGRAGVLAALAEDDASGFARVVCTAESGREMTLYTLHDGDLWPLSPPDATDIADIYSTFRDVEAIGADMTIFLLPRRQVMALIGASAAALTLLSDAHERWLDEGAAKRSRC